MSSRRPAGPPLLKRLADGTEASVIDVITDTMEYRALPLVRAMVLAALERQGLVVAVLYETPPSTFVAAFPAAFRSRIHCFGRAAADPSVGSGNGDGSADLTDPGCIVAAVTAVKATQAAASSPPVTVVVDTAAPYILAHSAPLLCMALADVADAGASKTMAVVHRDVLDPTSVAQLMHVASTKLELSPLAGNVGSCTATSRRASGKVTAESCTFQVTAEGKLLVRPFKLTTASAPALEDSGGLDISSDLTTFNLGLGDRNELQREAKANVKLPYTLSESVKSEQLQESSGRIFYQPDDADDFDDEDPDDDLDI